MTETTPSPAGPLGVGDVAPGFALRNQYGETVSLADFRGEKHVVLVFFPFAFSGICTGEFREIREHLEDFEADDVQVLGISCDAMESLRAWADAEGYFFPLLSDFWPHGAASRAYGVFWEKTGFAIRGTFLVDSGRRDPLDAGQRPGRAPRLLGLPHRPRRAARHRPPRSERLCPPRPSSGGAGGGL